MTSENRIPISRTAQKQHRFYRLERDVRHGTLFLLGAQIASQLVSFSLFAVLYRLMGPEPYGFLGMCLPLILILRSVSTLGLNVVTVQLPQHEQATFVLRVQNKKKAPYGNWTNTTMKK